MRLLLRRGIVHRTVERYKRGTAFWDKCPACASSYLRVPIGKAYSKPCPACGSALDSIGAIGIDVAVGLIAAQRRNHGNP